MSDNNPHFNKKHWKGKRKKRRQSNMSNSFNHTNNTNDTNGPHRYNVGLSFPESHATNIKVTIPTRVNSDESSFQTSTSANTQVTTNSFTMQNLKPSSLAHNLPSSSAAVDPRETPVDSRRDSSTVAAGPSGQMNGQRMVNYSFSPALPSKCLAIDCEMVGTGPKGSISQLARCSLVSYDGDVVYDKFIRPPLPITDYRTRWSGIRKSDLYGATPYNQARIEILKLLKGKVLIGHAIHNDLKVLNYSHPKEMTRDTSRIPLLNAKAGFPETQPASLKRLTKAIYNRDIQTGKKGHSSVEDAKATMELYKAAEAEWARKIAPTAHNRT